MIYWFKKYCIYLSYDQYAKDRQKYSWNQKPKDKIGPSLVHLFEYGHVWFIVTESMNYNCFSCRIILSPFEFQHHWNAVNEGAQNNAKNYLFDSGKTFILGLSAPDKNHVSMNDQSNSQENASRICKLIEKFDDRIGKVISRSGCNTESSRYAWQTKNQVSWCNS